MDLAPQNWQNADATFDDFIDYLTHPDGYEIAETRDRNSFAKALRQRVGIKIAGGGSLLFSCQIGWAKYPLCGHL